MWGTGPTPSSTHEGVTLDIPSPSETQLPTDSPFETAGIRCHRIPASSASHDVVHGEGTSYRMPPSKTASVGEAVVSLLASARYGHRSPSDTYRGYADLAAHEAEGRACGTFGAHPSRRSACGAPNASPVKEELNDMLVSKVRSSARRAATATAVALRITAGLAMFAKVADLLPNGIQGSSTTPCWTRLPNTATRPGRWPRRPQAPLPRFRSWPRPHFSPRLCLTVPQLANTCHATGVHTDKRCTRYRQSGNLRKREGASSTAQHSTAQHTIDLYRP